MGRAVTVRAAGALCMLAAVAGPARASDWTVAFAPVGGTVNASPASANTITAGGLTYQALYFTNGNSVYGYKSDGTALGSHATGDVVENFPVAVPLQDGRYYVFIASQDGFLYKLNAADLSVADSVDLRRPSSLACTMPDRLVATPTVQLAAYARSDWTYYGARDVVYVITKHGCGDHTLNQVIALDAARISTYNAGTGAGALWVFNAGGERLMDYGAQGCGVDYDRNVIYCGTDLNAGHSQPTLWSIYTGNTSSLGVTAHAGGNLAWSQNIDAVVTRPQLGRNQLLYVADYVGRLHAFDPDTGTERWNVNVSASATNIAHNIWAEFRSPYDHMVFVTDTTGTLHSIYDGWSASSGTGSGSVVWNFTPSGAHVVSIAAFQPTPGKIYVGLNNSTMHQLNFAQHKDEAYATINGSATDSVLDGTFEVTGGATDINKLVAISDGSGGMGAVLKQFTIPFTSTPTSSLQPCSVANNPADPNQPDIQDGCDKTDNSPAGCAVGSSTTDCCSVGRCSPDQPGAPTGHCVPSPRTNGPGSAGNNNQCDDGAGTCTNNKVCKAGNCLGAWVGVNPTNNCSQDTACNIDPTRACGAGQQCFCTRQGPPLVGCSCVDTTSGSTGMTVSYTPAGGLCTQGGVCQQGETCNTGSGLCQYVWHPCGSLSHSCDNEAPAGVITHGGNRTCTNGVCGRTQSFCTMPSTTDLGTKDQNGIPASINATQLAFARTFNANLNREECIGYMASYDQLDTYSGNYNTYLSTYGAGCDVCGNGAACSGSTCPTPPTSGSVSLGSNGASYTAPSFADNTNGEPGYSGYVTNVAVALSGITEIFCFFGCNPCSTGTLGITLNGWQITGTTNSASCSSSCSSSTTYVCNNILTLNFTASGGLPQCPSTTGPCWNYHGMQTVKVTALDANVRVQMGQIQVTATTSERRNYIHTVHPGPSVVTNPTALHPGFLNGVQPWQSTFNSSSSAVGAASTYIWRGSVQGDGAYANTLDRGSGVFPLASQTPPKSLFCSGSSCPFTVGVFNFFPTPPATDGLSVINPSSGGVLYYGNWSAVGDLVQASFVIPPTGGNGSWSISALGQNSGAPNEYTSSIAVANHYNTHRDQYIRMAHNSKIDFWTQKNGFAYVLDLASTAVPFGLSATSGGVGPYYGNAGMQYITAITSITVDALNQTNDTYAEVREVRPSTAACPGTYVYTVQIRGDDFSVRPLADYPDVNGANCATLLPGLYTTLNLPPSYVPPPIAAQSTAGDGRITTDSVSYLHRVQLNDPTKTSTAATINSYLLPP